MAGQWQCVSNNSRFLSASRRRPGPWQICSSPSHDCDDQLERRQSRRVGNHISPIIQSPMGDGFRRYLVVAVRSGEGPLTEHITATQARPPERVFMPHTGPWSGWKVGYVVRWTSPGSLHSFRVCHIAACEPFAAADIAVMHLGGNLNDPPGLPGCRARAQLHVFSIIPSRCGTALLNLAEIPRL